MTELEATGWSTSNELMFIARLADRPNAISLLNGYLSGMKRRADLGRLDAKMCEQFAKEALEDVLRRLVASRS